MWNVRLCESSETKIITEHTTQRNIHAKNGKTNESTYLARYIAHREYHSQWNASGTGKFFIIVIITQFVLTIFMKIILLPQYFYSSHNILFMLLVKWKCLLPRLRYTLNGITIEAKCTIFWFSYSPKMTAHKSRCTCMRWISLVPPFGVIWCLAY